MTQIPGLETIRGLAGEPQKQIEVGYKTMRAQDNLRQIWNVSYIAIIPYCFKCHQPLVWHSPPDGEDKNILFHCPRCKREWVKGEGW